MTLPHSVALEVNLFHTKKNILPVTTLRNLYRGRQAVVEAVWYLRGENHIEFLQGQKCKFWDVQAVHDTVVGLNYGLLTNFPPVVNQLLTKVIAPLCEGRRSRSMICSLVKPDEETVQAACTTSVQFCVQPAVEVDQLDRLNMTVFQRSSDVILGLPHDVIAWSTILHLARHDVLRRSGGKQNLAPGKLTFDIAGGGAHVYSINEENLNELLNRDPKPGSETYLTVNVGKEEKDIFQFAREFQRNHVLIKGYKDCHPAISICRAKSK
jgi:thymidylate synthase